MASDPEAVAAAVARCREDIGPPPVFGRVSTRALDLQMLADAAEASAGARALHDEQCLRNEIDAAAVPDLQAHLAQARAEVERLKGELAAQHNTELVRLCELDAENREKIAAAARRAKEHRRQLRQMNKAIERYRASYVEQVHRNELEKEHATLRAREFDTKLHSVRGNWGIAEARKRTLEHENTKLRTELAAAQERRDDLADKLAERDGQYADLRTALTAAQGALREFVENKECTATEYINMMGRARAVLGGEGEV